MVSGGVSDSEKINLEQLSEELIQVFYFENIDKSTDSQKEELIKKILKLGGKNYTCEDLRNDLLRIEQEDNSARLSLIMDLDLDKKLKLFNKKKFGAELDQQDLKGHSGS